MFGCGDIVALEESKEDRENEKRPYAVSADDSSAEPVAASRSEI